MNDTIRPCAPDLAERVVERLGLPRAPEPDLDGLDRVYGAFCRRVPFDNLRKRRWFAAGASGPLPGATAHDFWSAWLEDGTGGTCWAGAAALGELLAALGFTVRRALATMHPGPHARDSNHGTLIVEVDDASWLLDASTTNGVALPLDGRARAGAIGGAEIRRGDADETLLFWRPLHSPAGIVFRVDAIGVDEGAFSTRHEATRGWSLFNYGLNVRAARDGGLVGIGIGMRIAIDASGGVSARRLDERERVRVLVEELGISERAATGLPADEPVPPPPGMPPERWAQALAALTESAPRA